jgi:hypothetical protein
MVHSATKKAARHLAISTNRTSNTNMVVFGGGRQSEQHRLQHLDNLQTERVHGYGTTNQP